MPVEKGDPNFEAPVWSAIRPGVAHADDAPIRQPETARPLHVQQEERNRVVGPGELQAAAGERAGIDLGARRVRDEPPAVEAPGEAAAAARGIDRVRVDVDQIGRAPEERMAKRRVGFEPRGELGLVVGGDQHRLAHANRLEEPADDRAPGAGIGLVLEGGDEAPRRRDGLRVARALPHRDRPLDCRRERREVEVVEQRWQLAWPGGHQRTGAAQRAAGDREELDRQRERARDHAA